MDCYLFYWTMTTATHCKEKFPPFVNPLFPARNPQVVCQSRQKFHLYNTRSGHVPRGSHAVLMCPCFQWPGWEGCATCGRILHFTPLYSKFAHVWLPNVNHADGLTSYAAHLRDRALRRDEKWSRPLGILVEVALVAV
jgi:hypothetical protein